MKYLRKREDQSLDSPHSRKSKRAGGSAITALLWTPCAMQTDHLFLKPQGSHTAVLRVFSHLDGNRLSPPHMLCGLPHPNPLLAYPCL